MNKYMKKAIDEANIAYKEGNVPVGAVIVNKNNIVSFNHNKKNTENISVYHAEILCIIDACKKIGSWYLDNCDMYVTLEPCDMCKAAIAESRIKNVYYLVDSNYSDNLKTNINNINLNKLDDDTNYINLLSDFFKNIRD